MITSNSDGTTSFRVYLPHAAKVELLGDFTSWREGRLAMDRENPGWWTATVRVPEGDHTFGYLVDGSIWLADYAAHGVKLSSYGGWISRLCIKASVETEAKQTADSLKLVAA